MDNTSKTNKVAQSINSSNENASRKWNDAKESSNFEALFDSGYSSTAVSVHSASSLFQSSNSVDLSAEFDNKKPTKSVPQDSSQIKNAAFADSGLCIDSGLSLDSLSGDLATSSSSTSDFACGGKNSYELFKIPSSQVISRLAATGSGKGSSSAFRADEDGDT